MTDRWQYIEPILQRIAAVAPERGVILLLRHSIRERIAAADMVAAVRAPLTDEGRELASVFGSRLGAARPVRLFHSPVPRCIDTAECIAAGLAGQGGSSEMLGTREFLAAPYMRDPARAMTLFARLGGVGFARSWCRGELETAIVQDHREAGTALLDALLSTHEGAAPGTLDLHVTHDLTVAALLSLLFEMGSLDVPWPDYLDGAVLAAFDDQLTLFYRGDSRVVAER